MTDQPISEPELPDPQRDRTDQEPKDEDDQAPIRPSPAEGGGGTRSLTSSPASAHTLGALLTASARAVGRSLPITWATDDVLLRQDVPPWTGIPLWIPETGMDFDVYAQEGDLVPDVPGTTGFQTATDTWDWLGSPGAAAEVEDRDWVPPARLVP